MNFESMPELKNPNAYPLLIVVMCFRCHWNADLFQATWLDLDEI